MTVYICHVERSRDISKSLPPIPSCTRKATGAYHGEDYIMANLFKREGSAAIILFRSA